VNKQRTLPLVFICAVFILAGYDLVNRIWQKNVVVQNADLAGNLNNIKKVGLSQGQLSELVNLYEKYSVLEKDTSNNGKDLSDAISSPTRLLLNEHILELKAIVALSNESGRGTDYFCLIKNTNIQSAGSEVIKIMNNQTIHGHRLHVIDNVSVKLISEDLAPNEDKSLTEFVLTMYEKNDNVLYGKK